MNLHFPLPENEEGDHRPDPRNSAQYERVVELLIMRKAKSTPRQISLLPVPSVSRPRSIIRQLRKSLEIFEVVDHQTTSKISRDFRSCLMIDLGRETDGNNEICLGVHFALCITLARGRCRRRKAGLLVAEFCAHISMRAPQRSLNTTQRFQRGKSFPIASYPISFLPPPCSGTRNRWFAYLATTVDNTIKMADRSFKHGRQWCIRRIESSNTWIWWRMIL